MRVTRSSLKPFLFCVALSGTPAAYCLSAPAAQSQPHAATRPSALREHNFARWEKDISAFEAKDRTDPPAKGGILFIGASSIRMWKSLPTDYPHHHVINRGFGGSEIADSTHFAERIIFPYEPRMVLLRAGGNDIHAGKSVEQVFEDYKAFVAKVHARLPKTEIVYISQSSSPSRWAERDAEKRVNTLVKEFTDSLPYLKYIETYDLSITADGKPRPELFVKDQLHFNAEGYRLMADRVRPVLPK